MTNREYSPIIYENFISLQSIGQVLQYEPNKTLNYTIEN